MRKFKTTAFAASLTATALLLTACGTGTGTQTASTGSGNDDLQAKIAAVTDDELKGTQISLGRMFGDCEETTQGVIDPGKATNECEAIQILTNQFNAENKWGIKIERLGGTDWNSYYDALNAAIAGGEPPDIANLHDYALSDYATRGQLVTFDPAALGIDMNDATEQAKKSVVYDGKTVAVPFDSHAILAHVNTDILKKAGYLGSDGRPVMPTSADEMLAMGKAVKETTGKYLFSMGFPTDDMGWRVFYSLVRQQGSDLITDGKATVNTEAATAAMELLKTMIDAGYINTVADYAGSIDEWKNEKSAILVTGSWAMATGHNAPRVSIIESADYQAAPNREFYTKTALNNMAFVPQVENWTAIKQLIHNQLEEVWFNGKDLKPALDEAQARVEQELK